MQEDDKKLTINRSISFGRVSTRHSILQLRALRKDASIASEPIVPNEFVIKPTATFGNTVDTSLYDTGWYDCWVRSQIEAQPQELYSVLPEAHGGQISISRKALDTVWHAVWAETSKGNASIDSIVTNLLSDGFLSIDKGDNATLDCAVNLVFALIGWQTMLYKPDMGSCSSSQLAIVDETDGHRGYAYMELRQSQLAATNPLHQFLMGFGVLLPCYHFNALTSDDDKRAVTNTKTVSPRSLNAYILNSAGSIQCKWTDSLACHLEFDVLSSTLYLFRFPTFCAIHLLNKDNNETKSTLHCCTSSATTTSHWATHDDVNDLLRETLLSYRLLFGQHKASRQFFRSLRPFGDLSRGCEDVSLFELCGRKQSNFATRLQEKDCYFLSEDFPVLRSRLAILAYQFSSKRPRTWRELWSDRRDSATWFTFWIILIIGGIGIVLAFTQVILQIVQISLQAKET